MASLRKVLAISVLLMPSGVNGQELDPMDPVTIADGVDRADLVVIGKFSVTWVLPVD